MCEEREIEVFPRRFIRLGVEIRVLSCQPDPRFRGERKLLYRRRPLSPPVSPPLSPVSSPVTYPSSRLAGPIVPRPRERHRRRFSDAQVAALEEIAWWDWPIEEILAHVDMLGARRVDEFIAKYKKAA